MSKIFIIEDEPLLREMYCQVFAKHGFEVILAESAEEGLIMIEQEVPDLILLDILLPNASGLEMLEQLRHIPSNIAKTKVVAFSNYDNKIAREKAKTLGVLDYLIKTEFSPQEIVERIMTYLS